MARRDPHPKMGLYALMHDAHESVTGDVPSTWKTEDIRNRQFALDVLMYQEFRVPFPTVDEEDKIRDVDCSALYAEASVIGPPGIMEWFGVPADPLTIADVEFVMAWYPNPSFTDGINSPGVRDFIDAFKMLEADYRSYNRRRDNG